MQEVPSDHGPLVLARSEEEERRLQLLACLGGLEHVVHSNHTLLDSELVGKAVGRVPRAEVNTRARGRLPVSQKAASWCDHEELGR